MNRNIRIIAIGGGEIGRPRKEGGFYPIETESIDKHAIRSTGKKHPKLLFLPTASSDDEKYYDVVKKYFGGRLGCKTDVLYLIKKTYSKEEMRTKIEEADIVYVGGGNTLKMLKVWRKKGVDKLLIKAAQKGTILSGVSAGAICWFNYANSDSMKFGPSKIPKLVRLKGLGLVDLMACPHYDAEESRRPSLIKMVNERYGTAIALQNCTAIEIYGDQYRILTSSKDAKAYLVYKTKGKVIEHEIPITKGYSKLEELLCIPKR